jgi:hypothetical protein
MELIVKDLPQPGERKSLRKTGQIGRERPHFFGFQPPKKIVGSLPPAGTAIRAAFFSTVTRSSEEAKLACAR